MRAKYSKIRKLKQTETTGRTRIILASYSNSQVDKYTNQGSGKFNIITRANFLS